MPLNIEQVPGFVETVLKKYVTPTWQDISLPLQEYYFAGRLFDKASLDSMGGPFIEWKLQVANPGNFSLSGPYAVDATNRQELMTHGSLGWSQSTVNYTYDVTEDAFKRSAQEIVNHMDVLEHAMMNDYWVAMEDLMFGTGPSSPNQVPRPPSSLFWWLQPMPMTTAATSTTAGTPKYTSPGFYGFNPPGFSSTALIDATKYTNWANRAFTYSVMSRDDFVDKTIESIDKCRFKPAAQYADTTQGYKPKWELLTTYSRLAICRRLLQQANDNVGDDLAQHSGVCYIRGVPMNWIPNWTNPNSSNIQYLGPIMGVNWKTFKAYYAPGLRMQKRAPYQDKDRHNVRWRVMDDSMQIICYDRRANFIGTSLNWVTETA